MYTSQIVTFCPYDAEDERMAVGIRVEDIAGIQWHNPEATVIIFADHLEPASLIVRGEYNKIEDIIRKAIEKK